jgi:hypothetical protein
LLLQGFHCSRPGDLLELILERVPPPLLEHLEEAKGLLGVLGELVGWLEGVPLTRDLLEPPHPLRQQRT